LRSYSPGGQLTAFAPALRLSAPTPSWHRLRPGLPGFLIPFAPLAFAVQRQVQPRAPLSPLVFLRISTHFTTPPGIPRSSAALQTSSLECTLPVEPGDFTSHLNARLPALYAQ